MTTEELLPLFRKEAELLRIHATPEEIKSLHSADINPDHVHTCIYGQMTGHCHSERAFELIKLCCDKTFSDSLYANGALTEAHKTATRRTGSPFAATWSPIEKYIVTATPAKIGKLVNFIQGTSQSL